jgi:formin-binding protein 1
MIPMFKLLIGRALAKRYLEKKAKKSASLSVGDTPAITPGSLESASLTTWTTILDDVENLSRERGMLADSFNAQIADPLRVLQSQCEELRKKVQYHFIFIVLHVNNSTSILWIN